MTILMVGFVAAVGLILVIAGVVIGWVVGTNDRQIDIMARRLAAEQRIEVATRATLHAMRDAVRRGAPR